MQTKAGRRREEMRLQRREQLEMQAHGLEIEVGPAISNYQLFYETQAALLEQAMRQLRQRRACEMRIRALILTPTETAESCPICLGDIENAVSTICKHTFHKECILEWAKNTNKCPLCRQDMCNV